MANTTGLDPKDLLDHNLPFDEKKVQLLDMMVEALYSKNQQQMMQANQYLTEFQQDGTSWQYTDIILENSNNTNTKFIALTVLEGAVKNRWKVLPEDQKNGIKQYISKLVIEMSQDDSINTATDHLLSKLDQTLVSIVKHEWTTTWKEFITEICEASKTHQGI